VVLGLARPDEAEMMLQHAFGPCHRSDLIVGIGPDRLRGNRPVLNATASLAAAHGQGQTHKDHTDQALRPTPS
jgi:hypothetical protein